jgi:hypothetical protein
VVGILSDIYEIITNIPAYILYAIESSWNAFVSAIDGAFEAATSLIALPAIPTIPYLPTLNWFFPIGAVMGVLGLMVTGYITFLAVRWIFKWSGAL